MNLYLITQEQNTGWDSYDSAVVCAPDEETARHMHPSGSQTEGYDRPLKLWWEAKYPHGSWARDLEAVAVKLIGEAAADVAEGIVCASFNAG